MFTSCSEEDDTKEEYPGWQSKNDTYWNNLYAEAKAKQESGDASWKVIPSYAYSTMPASQLQAANCIVVHVNEKGTGEGVPLAKDTVRVHYRGHLLPSTTYTDGFQFDRCISATTGMSISLISWVMALRRILPPLSPHTPH